MALASTGAALGDPKTYTVSPEIKRYTLMDLGFLQTKNGNFQLERSLDPDSPFTAAIKLRITFKKDLTAFQMAVTTGNGLKALNIFKDPKNAGNVEQYNYIIENLIERGVLTVKG